MSNCDYDADTESLLEGLEGLSDQGRRALKEYARIAARQLPKRPGYVLKENYRRVHPARYSDSDELQQTALEKQCIEVAYFGKGDPKQTFKVLKKEMDSVERHEINKPSDDDSDSEDKCRKKEKCKCGCGCYRASRPGQRAWSTE